MPISEISKSIMAALSKDVESIDDFIDVLDTLGDEGEQLRNEILLLLNERPPNKEKKGNQVQKGVMGTNRR